MTDDAIEEGYEEVDGPAVAAPGPVDWELRYRHAESWAEVFGLTLVVAVACLVAGASPWWAAGAFWAAFLVNCGRLDCWKTRRSLEALGDRLGAVAEKAKGGPA